MLITLSKRRIGLRRFLIASWHPPTQTQKAFFTLTTDTRLTKFCFTEMKIWFFHLNVCCSSFCFSQLEALWSLHFQLGFYLRWDNLKIIKLGLKFFFWLYSSLRALWNNFVDKTWHAKRWSTNDFWSKMAKI